MAKWSRKIWIGIGAASLVGVAGTRLANAQHEKTPSGAPPTAGEDTGGQISGGMIGAPSPSAMRTAA
ncbi:MAG TPA: hypothetical protein VE665_03560 [Hyphomicrobiaceae bacterium]|jgi:hypothetical protein|nr:hypothetical protein [Hyphomicrobiaceae bacterium]